MLVTINSFRTLLKDKNLKNVPIPGDNASSQSLTAAGNAAALPVGVIGVEIVTDTAITVNAYGTGTARLIPANSVAWFPVVAGQIIAVATV